MRRASIDTQLTFPFAGKSNARLFSQFEAQLLWLRKKSALRLRLQDANRHDILARLQYTIRNEIDAWILDPRAGADLRSVDVRRIHALNRAQEQQGAPSRNRVRYDDLFPEPGHCGCLRYTQVGKSAGNLNHLPGRIV